MVKKICLIAIFSCICICSLQAQHLWYENETETENITFTSDSRGTFTTNEVNPKTDGININAVTSKFVREADVTKGFSYFELSKNLLEDVTYTISLKAYVDIPTEDLTSINRIRFYIKNTTTGDLKAVQLKFSKGQEWEEFSFVFNEGDLPSDGFLEDGYNQVYIGYGNGQGSTSEVTYYIDQIYGSVLQEIVVPDPLEEDPLVDVLKGSWGGRFYVRGGEDLDVYVASEADGGKAYNYIAGAQEMANNYPTMGHVITNGTNNANAQLWTLRTNPNVDAVMGVSNSVVDEEFVPSLANEQIIIDVIDIFKNSGKKVILYVNSQSPANRATAAGAVAWNNYVDTYFAGDGHAAWMNYCEGYVKRFTEIGVDGYWFDSFGSYNINNSLGNADVDSTTEQRAEFVEMIRNAAPNATITTNIDKDSFVDENGDLILVDTDGIDESVGVDGTGDDPNRDYAIIKMTATNSWSDFTAGHITPLGQGAPPNSWAYEEFTVPDIEESSISIYEENSKQTLKHLFLPIRSTWSSERSDLMFDKEQAYRFAKRITDAGGSVTFSNTTSTDGTTSDDEVEILTYMDQQFAVNADATVYQRPAGAFLVGEDHTLNTWSGFSDSTWGTDTNWSKATVPVLTDNIIIPSDTPNYPTITTAVSVNSVSIEDNASLVFSAGGTLTATTNVVYKRIIDANKWYQISSPVIGESYDNDWVTENDIATGTSSNRGVSIFDNTSLDDTTGYWRYFQTDGAVTSFNVGQGYGVIRATTGTISFTGSEFYSDSQTTTITQSTSNYNLVSNPFTAYLNLGDFFQDNATSNLLGQNSIWVWNATNATYDVKTSGNDGDYEIAHGQAFFVEAGTAANTDDNLTFDINDVSHQGTDTFQKSTGTKSSISISITDENSNTRMAKIYFNEEATKGFDNGYDGELFGGASHSFALFSELLEDNGKNYQVQTLPTSLKQSAIIPLGLIVDTDKEIKINAEIENLPLDTFVYLEDKEKGSFTLLNDNGSHNFTTEQALTGKGRFYIHTSAKVLSTVNETLESVNVYKLNNSTLSIKGLSQGKANIKLFNTFGKQLMNTSFYSNGLKHQIYLPQLATGIYVVQLQTEKRQLNKKVVLE
jgi:hypothetical protein